MLARDGIDRPFIKKKSRSKFHFIFQEKQLLQFQNVWDARFINWQTRSSRTNMDITGHNLSLCDTPLFNDTYYLKSTLMGISELSITNSIWAFTLYPLIYFHSLSLWCIYLHTVMSFCLLENTVNYFRNKKIKWHLLKKLLCTGNYFRCVLLFPFIIAVTTPRWMVYKWGYWRIWGYFVKKVPEPGMETETYLVEYLSVILCPKLEYLCFCSLWNLGN